MAKRLGPFPWPPRPVFRSGNHLAPSAPREGVVTWNINTTCNYRCSYCTQRFLEDRKRWANDTPRFLENFRRKLPGVWEIKISGGEPFLHPTLFEISKGLKDAGHKISIVTNLSASLPKLETFMNASGNALRVFSASLHLEYIYTKEALDEFVKKLKLVRHMLPKEGSVNVTCVATRSNLKHLEDLVVYFSSHDIRFKIQPEKQERDIIKYTKEEKDFLLRLGGHNQLGKLSFSFKSRPCWAGAFSFTLDDKGEAWRCYPARRYRAQYLGNFLQQSFRLARGPSPCLYSYCNCTVPIEREMMSKKRDSHEI